MGKLSLGDKSVLPSESWQVCGKFWHYWLSLLLRRLRTTRRRRRLLLRRLLLRRLLLRLGTTRTNQAFLVVIKSHPMGWQLWFVLVPLYQCFNWAMLEPSLLGFRQGHEEFLSPSAAVLLIPHYMGCCL